MTNLKKDIELYKMDMILYDTDTGICTMNGEYNKIFEKMPVIEKYFSELDEKYWDVEQMNHPMYNGVQYYPIVPNKEQLASEFLKDLLINKKIEKNKVIIFSKLIHFFRNTILTDSGFWVDFYYILQIIFYYKNFNILYFNGFTAIYNGDKYNKQEIMEILKNEKK